jgi:hypothetical protein
MTVYMKTQSQTHISIHYAVTEPLICTAFAKSQGLLTWAYKLKMGKAWYLSSFFVSVFLTLL